MTFFLLKTMEASDKKLSQKYVNEIFLPNCPLTKLSLKGYWQNVLRWSYDSSMTRCTFDSNNEESY
jgi:hypothetical protein